MNKRQLWITNCVVWAVIWGILGVIIMPLWLFMIISLMMIMLPVGTPTERHDQPKHNPEEWSKQEKVQD